MKINMEAQAYKYYQSLRMKNCTTAIAVEKAANEYNLDKQVFINYILDTIHNQVNNM